MRVDASSGALVSTTSTITANTAVGGGGPVAAGDHDGGVLALVDTVSSLTLYPIDAKGYPSPKVLSLPIPATEVMHVIGIAALGNQRYLLVTVSTVDSNDVVMQRSIQL